MMRVARRESRLSSARVNVLFLTHRLPYAPNRGDRARAHFLIRCLQASARVHVVSLVHDEQEARHVVDLAPWAASVRVVRVPKYRNLAMSLLALPTTTPTTHSMLDAPAVDDAIRAAVAEAEPDVVLAYCSSMAKWALRPPLSSYPFVLDMVDVDSAKWRALAPLTRPPWSWIYRREARVLAAFEARAADRAVATLVVAPHERDSLVALTSRARVEVVPIGVERELLRPRTPPATSANVVFCGVMNYAPNEHAAVLLAREVWPLVKAACPEATLTLVGAHPTPNVRRLASTTLGVEVTGTVPDVKPFLWRAAVGAAPILTARGVQNKVLEAVAAGLPMVVTPNIAASLPPEVAPAIVVASGAEAIAAAIVRLLALAPETRRAMAASADIEALAWCRQLAPVAALLAEAAALRPRATGTVA